MSRRRNRKPQPTTDQRSPETRLEALVREPNAERARRTLIRIREDLDAHPDPAPWIAAARTLSERLVISEDSFYYLAELFTECVLLAATTTDVELVRLSLEMDDLERAHGLREDEFWDVDGVPQEWTSLNEAWERRADEIVLSYLRESGHADLVAVRDQNPLEVERRIAKGRVDLWGDDDEESAK